MTRMKNVLLVTQGFPYGVSEQGFLPTEYRKLAEAYHLSLLAFDVTNEPNLPLAENVRHYRYTWPARASLLGAARQLKYPEVRADAALLFRSRRPFFLRRLGRILLYSHRTEQITAQLRQIVRDDRIDIVYTYWCVQATLAAIRLKKEFPGLKVVTRFHGMDLYEEQIHEGWQPLRPFIARNCDRLIFICRTGMDYFLSHWGREWAEKAEIIHVGCRALPRAEPEYGPGKPLVLVSCSSVIPIKRVALIADSLAALPDSALAEWHHFGGGELWEDAKAHAAALLANRPGIRYTFHGPISNEALPQAYLDAGAQLFITVSETEGLPVSMMEAFAMGIPVAATAVGGIPEMVKEGSSGFLMPVNPAPSEVADVLEKYAAMSETEKRAMSQTAYECWTKDYDAGQNAEKLIRLLNRVMEGEQAE